MLLPIYPLGDRSPSSRPVFGVQSESGPQPGCWLRASPFLYGFLLPLLVGVRAALSSPVVFVGLCVAPVVGVGLRLRGESAAGPACPVRAVFASCLSVSVLPRGSCHRRFIVGGCGPLLFWGLDILAAQRVLHQRPRGLVPSGALAFFVL